MRLAETKSIGCDRIADTTIIIISGSIVRVVERCNYIVTIVIVIVSIVSITIIKAELSILQEIERIVKIIASVKVICYV